MASLPARPMSLAAAIRDGKTTFEEIGGQDAYFGNPAAATAEEGETTTAVLGGILAEANHVKHGLVETLGWNGEPGQEPPGPEAPAQVPQRS